MKRLFSNTLPALLVGACLRLFFVLKFPVSTSGDTGLYEQLAENWLKLGKFAMELNGQVTPVDVRMPGYPAFLALIYAVTGKTGEAARFAVMLAQVAVDLATCVVIAALAALLARLAGQAGRANRAFSTALWLAAVCPFTANYVAATLTEVWAVFLTSVALVLLVQVATDASGSPVVLPAGGQQFAKKETWKRGALAGFVVGVATLFRPESPLLLAAAFAVTGYWMLRRGATRRWLRLCMVMGIAWVVALLPWAIRNATSLHEFQPLAPKDAKLPGEVATKGLQAWERTWLYRMRDVYLVPWKLNDEAIQVADIPASAFDTPDERERVAMVLQRYNDDLVWTVEEDAMFAQIARERTARHPLRTYLKIPLLRAGVIWFSPRIELLPVSGHVFPLAYQWEEDPVDQRVTVLLFLLNVSCVGLGLWGAWRTWKHQGAHVAVALLLVYIVVRTAFLTAMETPEPRYVLECFPALIALGAQVMWRANEADAQV